MKRRSCSPIGRVSPCGLYCTVDFARAGVAPHTGATVGDCAAFESRSGGEAFVALMKPADLRNRDHLAAVRGLDGASIRAIFVERQMGARAVIVIDVRGQDPAQMAPVKDHYVIQTLTANRTNHALDVRVLPG